MTMTLDAVPQDIEAERAVLGALLVNPDQYAVVTATLGPADFYRQVHGDIFAAMQRMPVEGSPFCAEHQQAVGWERRQAGRSSTERGYGADWRRLRVVVLHEEPVCQLCHITAASVVDHIMPRAKGGTDERTNLRGVCGPCHHAKTGRDRFCATGAASRLGSDRPRNHSGCGVP